MDEKYHILAILTLMDEIRWRRRHGLPVKELQETIEVEAELYARDHITKSNKKA
jgi:hypothetical protein